MICGALVHVLSRTAMSVADVCDAACRLQQKWFRVSQYFPYLICFAADLQDVCTLAEKAQCCAVIAHGHVWQGAVLFLGSSCQV